MVRHVVSFMLLTILGSGSVAALGPGAGPAGSPELALEKGSARGFEVGSQGNVFWIDSFGTIRKNQASLGHRPVEREPRFLLDPLENVVWLDSYGSLHRNGRSYSPKVHQGRYWVSWQGNLYWIETFWNHLIRNGDNLGYEASWRSSVKEDRHGNVFYVDRERGRLHRNDQDMGLGLNGAEFWLGPGTEVYFIGGLQGDRRAMFSWNYATGQRAFVDWVTPWPQVRQDAAFNVYYAGPWGQLRRNGTGVEGVVVGHGPFHLDAAGNVYYLRNRMVYKGTESTGFESRGPFGVTPEGDVYHVTDSTWGTLARNGAPTGISLR